MRFASSVLHFILFNHYLWTITRSFLAVYEICKRRYALIFSMFRTLIRCIKCINNQQIHFNIIMYFIAIS